MKTAKEILEGARALLADPDRWTQKATARADNGRQVRPSDPAAVCWCMGGALAVVTLKALWEHERGSPEWKVMEESWERAIELVNVSSNTISGNSDRFGMIALNDDSRTEHGHVLQALDLAIARAGA